MATYVKCQQTLEGKNYFIDLTLVHTLRDMTDFDDSIIPDDYEFIGVDEAAELGFISHAERRGVNVLEEIHEEI